MPGRPVSALGNPTIASISAAADRDPRQPFSRPLGAYTGAPAPTVLKMVPVAPNVTTQIVATTRENRFVTLLAPLIAFTIAVGPSGVTALSGMALPPGIPIEIPLPGNQELHAVSDAPITLQLRVQVASALAGDLERRL